MTYKVYIRAVGRPTSVATLAATLATLVALGQPAAAQAPPARAPAVVLTLDAAIREAEQHAFANRRAAAEGDAAAAQARVPLKGILPSLRVEAGAVRTTDPIGAFGATLRQRAVSPAAFDPARLNNPAPITNVQGGLIVEVPLLNADAWLGRRAARAAAAATTAGGDWTAIGVRTDVIRAYFGAVVAGEQVAALETSQRAADATLRQVQALVQQGLVTKADALQAGVRALDVASQVLGARNTAGVALEQLTLLLGRTDGTLPVLPDSLPTDALVRAMAERDTSVETTPAGTVRADVRAAQEGVLAAASDHRRATSALLPRVNSFARYDWFAPTALFGGRPNWTVGVMASLSLFGGGSELADMAGTAARTRAALADREAAMAQSSVERRTARRAIVLALQRLDLASLAAEQSREAQRLVEKRYAAGLVSIADRLGADAELTGRVLAQLASRQALIDALATWRRASGGDPADLRTLGTGR